MKESGKHSRKFSLGRCLGLVVILLVGFFLIFVATMVAVRKPGKEAQRVRGLIKPGVHYETVVTMPMGRHLFRYDLKEAGAWKSVTLKEFSKVMTSEQGEMPVAGRLRLILLGMTPHSAGFTVELDAKGTVVRCTDIRGGEIIHFDWLVSCLRVDSPGLLPRHWLPSVAHHQIL